MKQYEYSYSVIDSIKLEYFTELFIAAQQVVPTSERCPLSTVIKRIIDNNDEQTSIKRDWD